MSPWVCAKHGTVPPYALGTPKCGLCHQEQIQQLTAERDAARADLEAATRRAQVAERLYSKMRGECEHIRSKSRSRLKRETAQQILDRCEPKRDKREPKASCSLQPAKG